MPEISNGPKRDETPSPATGNSLAVWAKLIGLLAGLAAFGFVIYRLSRIVHQG